MYYPRSFLKFILLGFLLVSAPLVYAMAELILSLRLIEHDIKSLQRRKHSATESGPDESASLLSKSAVRKQQSEI